ncbi:hypothetical protein BJ912DRAFT_991521 [Pholiota molesta]|nr:hypothetical protein BJ912DRAFT_991521 [Pholiota molesta]
MPTTSHSGRPVQQNPVLPWELTDVVIDHLRHDVRALGICGAVCSEWLFRSRYHVFSTVQLWPWRMRRFVQLAEDDRCTFTNFITRLEMDDSRGGKTSDGRTTNAGGQQGRGQRIEAEKNVVFNEAMAHSNLKCLAQVSAIQIRNVDWTTLSPAQQTSLRAQLRKFSQLRRLELHDVVFHDVREVVRILASVPSLHHITVPSSASNALRSIELGTDEGIAVLLNCVANSDQPHPLQTMRLRNVENRHLQYIRNALRTSGTHIQRLSLDFTHEKVSLVSEDDLDLSTLSGLRTLSVGGLHLASSTARVLIERTLPKILGRIEAPFFTALEVRFHLGAPFSAEAMACIDWSQLQRVLLEHRFFGLSTVRIVVEVSHSDSGVGSATCVEREMRAGMSELLVSGALDLRVVCESTMAIEGGLVYDIGDKE